MTRMLRNLSVKTGLTAALALLATAILCLAALGMYTGHLGKGRSASWTRQAYTS